MKKSLIQYKPLFKFLINCFETIFKARCAQINTNFEEDHALKKAQPAPNFFFAVLLYKICLKRRSIWQQRHLPLKGSSKKLQTSREKKIRQTFMKTKLISQIEVWHT